MTRDPARIDPILADLRRYWHAAPDLRLGQMVMGLLDLSGAPRYGEFNAEDDKVAAYLAAWAAANPPPPDHRDTLPPEIEAAIADAGQALVDAWDSAQDGPPHRFVVFVDPEGDPEVAAGWMAMARMHAAAIAAARESRPGGWADIVRFCERAGIKASPLRSAEARDAAKADVPTPPPEIEAAITAAAWSIAELDRRADVMAQPEIGALRTAITSALAAAREAWRREALEGAAGVEEAINEYGAWERIADSEGNGAGAEDIAQGKADALRAAIAAEIRGARADAIAECKAASALEIYPAADDAIEAFRAATWSEALCSLNSDGAPTHVAQASIDAAEALRAIAADKAALDATWRAHDLERDAEVAQAQAATHEACAALQAICAALHVTPSTGSTYCTEAVAMVLERVAADKARAVKGMRPVLSQADAERLVGANDDETLAATGDTAARAALLAALTGEVAP